MILAASIAHDVFTAILQGAPPGSVYALVALGFVLTYKTSGVFNLAFGAQAYVSAAMYFQARTSWGWGIVPALVLSVFVLAPVLGLVLEHAIFRHLRTSSPVSKLVVAIGLSVALPTLFDLLSGFSAVAGSTPEGIVPDGADVFYDPFGVYPFSRNELVQMAVALAGTIGLAALFRFSSLGLSMRAVVESPRMAELKGIDADRVSGFAWALSSFFAGMAGVLVAPRFNTLVAPDFFSLVVVAIAAAAIGRLVSLPRALAGGLGLGVFIALFNTFLPRWTDTLPWLDPLRDNLTPAIPFLVLFGIFTLWPAIRRTPASSDPLSGVDPPPPGLIGAQRSRTLTIATRIFGVGFLTVVGAVVFLRADSFWVFLVTQAVILSTIYLSITVITGFAGQISLCQGTFAAIGGFTVFQLADRYGVSVLLGALRARCSPPQPVRSWRFPCCASAECGWPSPPWRSRLLRRRDGEVLVGGWWRDVAAAGHPGPEAGPGTVGLRRRQVVPRVGVGRVHRRLAGGDPAGEGTIGRTMRAVRGSELAAQSIGIAPARTRIIAFAVSAFIAGLGGALLSIHQQNVNYANDFAPVTALFWIVLVVSLSVRSVEGAAQAGAAFSLFDAVILRGSFLGWILRSPDRVPGIFPIAAKWRFVLFGLTAVQFARHPEGMLEYSKRKATAKTDRRLNDWRARRNAATTPPDPPPDDGGRVHTDETVAEVRT